MILETIKWQEFHENGQLHIDGEIAVVKQEFKNDYDYRDGWYDCRGCDDLKNGKYLIPKGTPVCRIGVWSNFYDNGQIWWQIDFREGMHDSKVKRKYFPSYQKDGTGI